MRAAPESPRHLRERLDEAERELANPVGLTPAMAATLEALRDGLQRLLTREMN